jgi:hypothetical protein
VTSVCACVFVRVFVRVRPACVPVLNACLFYNNYSKLIIIYKINFITAHCSRDFCFCLYRDYICNRDCYVKCSSWSLRARDRDTLLCVCWEWKCGAENMGLRKSRTSNVKQEHIRLEEKIFLEYFCVNLHKLTNPVVFNDMKR